MCLPLRVVCLGVRVHREDLHPLPVQADVLVDAVGLQQQQQQQQLQLSLVTPHRPLNPRNLTWGEVAAYSVSSGGSDKTHTDTNVLLTFGEFGEVVRVASCCSTFSRRGSLPAVDQQAERQQDHQRSQGHAHAHIELHV